MTLQAISLLVQQRLITDVHELQGHVDLRVIPPVCPLDVAADFSHARELIDLARRRPSAGSTFHPGIAGSPRIGRHTHARSGFRRGESEAASRAGWGWARFGRF